MTTNCKVDFVTKEIRISKSFYKASQIVGTEEFHTMVQLQDKLPSFKIVLQKHPKPRCEVWYPTYTQMMDYIRFTTRENDGVLSELNDTIQLARITGKGYNMVRRWFIERYGDACNQTMPTFVTDTRIA